MMHHILPALIALMCFSCTSRSNPAANSKLPTTAESPKDWAGLYLSPSEIGAFAATILVLDTDGPMRMSYRMRSRSDANVIGSGEIRQDEIRGSFLIDGKAVYLPRASGFINNGKASLHASIERYTLVDINGKKVLMRDDALRAFQADNKLYDYGILIKVGNETPWLLADLKVEHPSIKLLYADPSKPWNDPYVHGANSR